MNLTKTAALFGDCQSHFQCPVCKEPMTVSNGSFYCTSGHCFDLSAKGYVNFLPSSGGSQNKYDKNLFLCRGQILQAGFYDPVVDTVTTLCKEIASAPALLDAGCGEGFYAKQISRILPEAAVFGLDNAKEAIQSACREASTVKWMVANLANLPMAKQSLDLILNILTPANYKEFRRILKKEGILVKIVPGRDYLKEIRSSVSAQLLRPEYQNDDVLAHFQSQNQLIETKELHYTLPVSQEQARLFLQMTPMTFHVDTARIAPAPFTHITIHLLVLIGRPKEQDGKDKPNSSSKK